MRKNFMVRRHVGKELLNIRKRTVAHVDLARRFHVSVCIAYDIQRMRLENALQLLRTFLAIIQPTLAF